MNSSYQVALVAAAVFCLAVIGYFITTRSSADPDASTSGAPGKVVAVTPAKPIPAPTKPKPVATNKPTPPAPVAPTPPKPVDEVTPVAPVTLDNDTPPTFTLNTPLEELTMPADLVGSEVTQDPADALDTPVTTTSGSTANPGTSKSTDTSTTLTTPAGFRKYTVKPGDTFTSIATAQYGSDRYWYDIAQANPLADPVKLRPGDVINLPDLSALTARNNRKPEFSSGPVEYLVRPGDNLEIIAKRHYGDSTTWREIYRANRTRIGPNPDRIQVGMKLVIPPAPRGAR